MYMFLLILITVLKPKIIMNSVRFLVISNFLYIVARACLIYIEIVNKITKMCK